ncbi:MAG: IPT/TIG domain-containing protein, partial [Flammeovirgaceae bacterium]
MNTRLLFFLLIFLCANQLVAQVPTITSFTPTSGPIGTTVTITGTNFSTTATSNIVYFGATKATVTAATASQLTVTVPTGASYQPITVITNGLTATSSSPFSVTFATNGVFNASSFSAKVDFDTG